MNSLRKLVENVGRGVGLVIIPLWAVADEALVRHLQKVFRLYEIQCVIDIGANEGQYHDLLRERVGYRGLILSFEPIALLYQALKSRAEIEDSAWQVFPYALGSNDDEAVINITRNIVFSSLRQPDSSQCDLFANQNQVVERQTIQLRRLDNLWPELAPHLESKNLYLKIDTQGYDLEVLRGAGSQLGNFAALQCELSALPIYVDMPDYLDVLGELRQAGFTISGFFPINHDKRLRAIEFDAVLVRSEPSTPS